MDRLPKLPSQPGYDLAYAMSYELAFDELAQSDIPKICQSSGASLGADSMLLLNFLTTPVTVDIKRRTVTSLNNSLPFTNKLIVLHYLVTAGGLPPSGKLISFKDLPDGAGYFQTFYKRAIAPIVTKFGNSLKELEVAAAALGGTPIALGDSGISIAALPQVTLNWVLWEGDSILPPEGSILFDSNITGYLPVEDIAVLCQIFAIRLCAQKPN